MNLGQLKDLIAKHDEAQRKAADCFLEVVSQAQIVEEV